MCKGGRNLYYGYIVNSVHLCQAHLASCVVYHCGSQHLSSKQCKVTLLAINTQ